MVGLTLSSSWRPTCTFVTVLASIGCSPNQAGGSKEVPLREARRIVVEIDAMAGATPSFAPLGTGVSPWLVLERNLEALSPPSSEGLSYPHSTEEIGTIDAAAGGTFSDNEIRDLADRHRDFAGGDKDAHFHVLFLDGDYAENRQHLHVQALNIGDSRIVAVFGAAATGDSDFERIVEQSALVHEFGHAFGLVNLGMPDVSGHRDPDDPRHCVERGCVMGAYSTLSSEAYEFLQGGDVPVLFGSGCLHDVASYYE